MIIFYNYSILYDFVAASQTTGGGSHTQSVTPQIACTYQGMQPSACDQTVHENLHKSYLLKYTATGTIKTGVNSVGSQLEPLLNKGPSHADLAQTKSVPEVVGSCRR